MLLAFDDDDHGDVFLFLLLPWILFRSSRCVTGLILSDVNVAHSLASKHCHWNLPWTFSPFALLASVFKPEVECMD